MIKNLKLEDICNNNSLQFVSDVSTNRASSKELYGEVFNIGSGKQHKVREIVNLVFKIIGKKKQIIPDSTKTRSFDTNKWVSDISKMKKTFKWRPKHSLEQGLRKNIEWFKQQI